MIDSASNVKDFSLSCQFTYSFQQDCSSTFADSGFQSDLSTITPSTSGHRSRVLSAQYFDSAPNNESSVRDANNFSVSTQEMVCYFSGFKFTTIKLYRIIIDLYSPVIVCIIAFPLPEQ